MRPATQPVAARPTSLLLSVVLLAACGGDESDATGPDTGTLVVGISTSGATPDPDGYTLQVGGRTESVASAGSVSIGGLAAGSVSVELTGLAVNCTVQGENPRTVTVTGGRTTQVDVAVDCPFALFDRILFHSPRGGDFQLYSAAPDGSDIVQLTDDPGEDQFAAISPEGTTIFWYRRDGPDLVLFRMNADGSGVERFTPSEPRMLENMADFSADGEWLVHTRNLLGVGFSNLHLSRVDGSERMPLTDEDASDIHPAWSPDGNSIAFSRRTGNRWTLHTVAADGSSLTRLTGYAGGELYPDWSPDGSTILYSREGDDGEYDLYLMDPDGSNVRLLLDLERSQFFGQWSPDGSRIAFSSNADGSHRIYVMNADGSGRQLVTPDFQGFWPRWSPMR